MIEICAKDLQKKVASIQTSRYSLYDKVFDRCIKGKLQVAANQGIPFCVANIQAFMPGFPAFDPMSCTVHIRNALMRKGFHVQILPPNNMLISWLTTRKQLLLPPAVAPAADDAPPPYNFTAFKKPNGKRVMFIQ
jgi:hypothetical protein